MPFNGSDLAGPRKRVGLAHSTDRVGCGPNTNDLGQGLPGRHGDRGWTIGYDLKSEVVNPPWGDLGYPS